MTGERTGRSALRYTVAGLRRRPLLRLAVWSLPEAVPAAVSGVAVARAVDAGFLAGRPLVGVAWLGALLAAAVVGAAGARQVYRHLGDLVEPFRDGLVRRVVDGALRRAVSGRPDDGAVSRLTHQVEIVRDSYAGLVVVLRNFAVTLAGAVVGLLSLAPEILWLVLPPFLLGAGAFVATLGVAAHRQREYVHADERLATSAGAVLSGIRDVTALGAQEHAAAEVAAPIEAQARAERAIARVLAARTLCFAVGGWLPLLVLLAAGGWLSDRGLTAGAIMGGLVYVLRGLQPSLSGLVQGLGGSGLRFVVTLGRILRATPDGAVGDDQPDAAATTGGRAASGDARAVREPQPGAGAAVVAARGLRFAYGPLAAPVLDGLDLTVAPGDHLAVVGVSGAGKSTLAMLLCGLLPPQAGAVTAGGHDVTGLAPDALAGLRVLIPQEAYVFRGSLRDNLAYLRPDADDPVVLDAVRTVGAAPLVDRIGGLDAALRPDELSAGERQLIALVRAYLSPAPLAVLDEATCHLDPEAERVVEEAFAARTVHGRPGTLIVVAHRVTSAQRARRVLVLDGAVSTVGTPETLIATSALYRELVGQWGDNGTSTAPAGSARTTAAA